MKDDHSGRTHSISCDVFVLIAWLVIGIVKQQRLEQARKRPEHEPLAPQIKMSIDPNKVKELKEFVKVLEAKPELLHLSEFSFFKSYIESLGGKIPEPKKKEHSHEHGHAEKKDHGHQHTGDCCGHDHGHAAKDQG